MLLLNEINLVWEEYKQCAPTSAGSANPFGNAKALTRSPLSIIALWTSDRIADLTGTLESSALLLTCTD